MHMLDGHQAPITDTCQAVPRAGPSHAQLCKPLSHAYTATSVTMLTTMRFDHLWQ